MSLYKYISGYESILRSTGIYFPKIGSYPEIFIAPLSMLSFILWNLPSSLYFEISVYLYSILYSDFQLKILKKNYLFLLEIKPCLPQNELFKIFLSWVIVDIDIQIVTWTEKQKKLWLKKKCLYFKPKIPITEKKIRKGQISFLKIKLNVHIMVYWKWIHLFYTYLCVSKNPNFTKKSKI